MNIQKLAQAKKLEKDIEELEKHIENFNTHTKDKDGKPYFEIKGSAHYGMNLYHRFVRLDDFIPLYKMRAEAELTDLKNKLAEL